MLIRANSSPSVTNPDLVEAVYRGCPPLKKKASIVESSSLRIISFGVVDGLLVLTLIKPLKWELSKAFTYLRLSGVRSFCREIWHTVILTYDFKIGSEKCQGNSEGG